jgi:hypothetical protein
MFSVLSDVSEPPELLWDFFDATRAFIASTSDGKNIAACESIRRRQIAIECFKVVYDGNGRSLWLAVYDSIAVSLRVVLLAIMPVD